MNKLITIVLSLAFMWVLSGCSSLTKDIEKEQIIIIPTEIKEVNISGYYNGSVINKGDFVVEEIDTFVDWVSELSLKHRTFDEGKAPSEIQAGGESYHFNVNNGELIFTYVDTGTELYVVYGEEWYEVLNSTELPFEKK